MDDGWDDDDDISVEDGWGDDELDLLNDDNGNDDDDELAALNNLDIHKHSSSSISVDEGWDWNNDEEGSSPVDTSINTGALNRLPPAPPAGPPPGITTTSKDGEAAERKLLQYIHDLQPQILNPLNQELDSKLNNPQSALELCRYYHDRPNLRAYTLDIEVPRMDYQIMISDELILTDALEIQDYFQQNPVDNLVDDMLLRASNQSLLADVFPVITGIGVEKCVRLQFGANAVADECRLVLDMRGDNARTLQVDCSMMISIPSGASANANDKLDLATLRIIIHFSPEPSNPFVKYQLVSIRKLLDTSSELDMQKIRIAARALDLEHMNLMEDESSAAATVNTNDGANLRDHFLNSIIVSNQAAANAGAGFKSALRDIDHVVNVSSKLNLLKKAAAAMPALPSADEILTAEQHHYRNEHWHEARLSNEFSNSSGHGEPLNPHTQSISQPQRPIVAAAAAPVVQKEESQRPKPIIGGMLISGIARLAKAAAIPDQEAATIPTLYRKERDSESLQSEQRSQTQKQPPPPPPGNPPMSIKSTSTSNLSSAPPRHDISPPSISSAPNDNGDDDDLSEGWSDDGLYDDDDFDDDIVPAENNTPQIDASASTRTTLDTKPILATPISANGTVEEPKKENRNELSPELVAERDFLLDKLALIKSTKVDSGLSNNKKFIVDDTGIIPTRKRFVSRSEILNFRAKLNDAKYDTQ
jgi:hypothetical protein